ncbi:hypothetical protein HYV86_07075 [Candidatus Woesearchaeota archaeon]|nr:hypothetical protein [Candidatus Woesearchaeota archaeon]
MGVSKIRLPNGSAIFICDKCKQEHRLYSLAELCCGEVYDRESSVQ